MKGKQKLARQRGEGLVVLPAGGTWLCAEVGQYEESEGLKDGGKRLEAAVDRGPYCPARHFHFVSKNDGKLWKVYGEQEVAILLDLHLKVYSPVEETPKEGLSGPGYVIPFAASSLQALRAV